MVGHMSTMDLTQRASLDRVHAGFASRAIAFTLDLVIIWVILIVMGAFVLLIGLYFPLGKLIAHLVGVSAGDSLRVPIAIAAMFVVFAGYPIFWWTMIGETPGKWILGLRVVRTDGRRLTVWRSVVRYLGYWLSALPLFLGFLWILVDDQRQGWHDKLADTCVIYAWQ